MFMPPVKLSRHCLGGLSYDGDSYRVETGGDSCTTRQYYYQVGIVIQPIHTVVELYSEDTCSCRVKTGGDSS